MMFALLCLVHQYLTGSWYPFVFVSIHLLQQIWAYRRGDRGDKFCLACHATVGNDWSHCLLCHTCNPPDFEHRFLGCVSKRWWCLSTWTAFIGCLVLGLETFGSILSTSYLLLAVYYILSGDLQ